MQQLMAVAEAGEVMPPKSTWFEPKLRSGLSCIDFGPRNDGRFLDDGNMNKLKPTKRKLNIMP